MRPPTVSLKNGGGYGLDAASRGAAAPALVQNTSKASGFVECRLCGCSATSGLGASGFGIDLLAACVASPKPSRSLNPPPPPPQKKKRCGEQEPSVFHRSLAVLRERGAVEISTTSARQRQDMASSVRKPVEPAEHVHALCCQFVAFPLLR